MTNPIHQREAALQRLAATGIRRSNYAPLLHRLLWWLGIPVAPPHFAPFWVNALTSGMVFAIAWGAIMWLIVWSRQNMSVAGAVATASAAGVLFGVAMASYYAHGRRKYQLPRWQELTE